MRGTKFSHSFQLSFLVVLAASILLINGASSALVTDEDNSDNHASTPSRIYGGWPVGLQGNFNFFTSIRALGTYHVCGGAVISRRHIVTAAHCFVNPRIKLPATSYSVFVAARSSSKKDNEYKVSSILTHSSYSVGNTRDGQDLAVIRLEKKIDLNVYKKLEIGRVPNVGSKVRFFGLGKDKHPEEDITIPPDPANPFLKSVLFRVRFGADCRLSESQRKYRICTGPFSSKHTNICRYDSGGPLVKVVDSSFVLVGVARSITGKCDVNGSLSIYTKLNQFRSILTYNEIIKGVQGNSTHWNIF